ncbi:MAG: hypothetical protein M3O46_16500, partial [Myxococcota bacterium]|nr:hypothetical protein [Myxococcota bacterium]
MKRHADACILWLVLAGCSASSTVPPQTAQRPPPQAAPYGYPPPYGQPPSQSQQAPPPPPQGSFPQAPQPPPSTLVRPLLGPLVGPLAWQAETRAVAIELVANLGQFPKSRVASVPLVFDPNPNEVNAFAGCDDSGAPFVAGTEGLLEAIDGISQTKATDELYGTQAYEAYVAIVAPRLVTKDGGSALLPAGIIPLQYWVDPRRISRAHE